MSEENVDVVRDCLLTFNAFMRGELVASALEELLDSHFEFHWHHGRTFPDEPQHLVGSTEFIEFWEQLRIAWADLIQEALEFIEASDDRVLTAIRLSGRGRESGAPFEVHFFQLWTIRDRRLRRLELFRHRADALEPAGQRE